MVYLLRRNIVGLSPHVNLLIMIHTGDDEEHSGSPGSALEKSTKAEDDGPFVFLKYRKMNRGLNFSPVLTVDSFSLPLNAYAIFHFFNKPIKIQTLDVFNLGHFAIR